MKLFVVLFCLVLFVACESEDCKKAKENYAKFSAGFAQAEMIYNQAVLAAKAVCDILTTNRTEKMSVGDACAKAKKVEEYAQVGLQIAKNLQSMYKAQMDAMCPAVVPVQ